VNKEPQQRVSRHLGSRPSGPVILLSYPHSGAARVQAMLAAGTGLACTSRTGIVPLCAAAAETWRRVDDRDGLGMSELAITATRGMLAVQITMILTAAGKSRWCELATTDPIAARSFAQVFPDAAFVCVHRGCLEVIRDWIAASPWGLHSQGLAPYLLSYPGNSVAALAAHWADFTEALLAFEEANAQIARRIRYENATAEPGRVLTGLLAWLGVDDGREVSPPEQLPSADPRGEGLPALDAEVPAGLIPLQLRQRIIGLHTKLGYAPPEFP
jgi:Sulfotransferase family